MHPDEDKNLNHTRGDIIDFYSLKKKVAHSEISVTNFVWVDGADAALFSAALYVAARFFLDAALFSDALFDSVDSPPPALRMI